MSHHRKLGRLIAHAFSHVSLRTFSYVPLHGRMIQKPMLKCRVQADCSYSCFWCGVSASGSSSPWHHPISYIVMLTHLDRKSIKCSSTYLWRPNSNARAGLCLLFAACGVQYLLPSPSQCAPFQQGYPSDAWWKLSFQLFRQGWWRKNRALFAFISLVQPINHETSTKGKHLCGKGHLRKAKCFQFLRMRHEMRHFMLCSTGYAGIHHVFWHSLHNIQELFYILLRFSPKASTTHYGQYGNWLCTFNFIFRCLFLEAVCTAAHFYGFIKASIIQKYYRHTKMAPNFFVSIWMQTLWPFFICRSRKNHLRSHSLFLGIPLNLSALWTLASLPSCYLQVSSWFRLYKHTSSPRKMR